MSKKITIELSDKEYEALAKAFENAKNNKMMPTKALNIDDFCKEVINVFANAPTPDQLKDQIDQLKDLKLDDILSQLGGLGGLGGDAAGDLFGGKKQEQKQEEKKDEVPDEQKYKS